MSKTLIRQSRQFSAVTLILAAFIILSFAFVQRSRSANPVAGTLNPAGPPLSWVGTSSGGASPEGETSCVTGVTCESFTLTLSGTPADWIGKKARIVVSATQAASDYDVYIHKGTAVDAMGRPTGPIAASGANSGTPPEVMELDPNIASVGTGVFMVHVVYWLAPATDQYTATATSVAAAVPTPTPSPGGTPTATPVVPGSPRFANHYAPPGVMEDAAEPTMGVNWNSENNPRGIANSFKNKVRLTGAENQTFNGGTSLYYGGVNDFFLRATSMIVPLPQWCSGIKSNSPSLMRRALATIRFFTLTIGRAGLLSFRNSRSRRPAAAWSSPITTVTTCSLRRVAGLPALITRQLAAVRCVPARLPTS
jgi:hypothetical protein